MVVRTPQTRAAQFLKPRGWKLRMRKKSVESAESTKCYTAHALSSFIRTYLRLSMLWKQCGRVCEWDRDGRGKITIPGPSAGRVTLWHLKKSIRKVLEHGILQTIVRTRFICKFFQNPWKLQSLMCFQWAQTERRTSSSWWVLPAANISGGLSSFLSQMSTGSQSNQPYLHSFYIKTTFQKPKIYKHLPIDILDRAMEKTSERTWSNPTRIVTNRAHLFGHGRQRAVCKHHRTTPLKQNTSRTSTMIDRCMRR